jgi:hypothetical protein
LGYRSGIGSDPLGELKFIDSPMIGSNYVAVTAEDLISLS